MNREQTRDEIKQAISCLEYLQPAANHSGNNGYCCPYCNSGHDGTPGHDGAVKYFADTNTWHCYACDRGGDVIDLYEAQTGCDYSEALNTLAAWAGLTIDGSPTAAQTANERRKTSPQSEENRKGNKQTDEAKQPADYSKYYKTCAERLTDTAAISYLQARGISEQTARAFNIGYDPEADPAAAPGATTSAGKIHATPRIVIPCNTDFYIARSIDPDTPAQYKAPNPKGSRTQLFNAAAIHSGAEHVFVVEGVFDALSFAEADQPAIALNGKGNGKLLLQELQEHPAQVKFVIVPDNDRDPKTDADTKKRAEELNAALQGMGYKSIVYNVAGTYHDVNDALTQGAIEFIENMQAAIDEIERDELDDFFNKIQTEAYKPHKTGLTFFDKLLRGGIISQSLLLLVAAPEAGKTTLCQQLAETMAEHKTQVLYFNFEMSTEQMTAKAISSKYYRGNGGDMSMLDILQGYNWTDADRAGIKKTLDKYRRDNYPYIKYNPANVHANIDELLTYLDAAGTAAHEAGKDAPAVIIDYLHLLTSNEQMETADLIKKAITGLKGYAIKYDTFVVGIIAANRDSMKNGRFTINSGRDSSNLEYTGDYMLSLNYSEIDNGHVDPADPEKLEQLKMQQPRDMIIRVLKARLIGTQPAAHVFYDAKHNIFYGAAGLYDAPDAGVFDE